MSLNMLVTIQYLKQLIFYLLLIVACRFFCDAAFRFTQPSSAVQIFHKTMKACMSVEGIFVDKSVSENGA